MTADPPAGRPRPGHVAHAHPQDADARTAPRVWHRRSPRTNQRSGHSSVNAGSLFPGLRRLERDGLIRGEWRVTENNRRAKSYHLTPQGRARLRRETRQWEAQATAIARILAVAPEQL